MKLLILLTLCFVVLSVADVTTSDVAPATAVKAVTSAKDTLQKTDAKKKAIAAKKAGKKAGKKASAKKGKKQVKAKDPFEVLLSSKSPIDPKKSLAVRGNMRAKLVTTNGLFVYDKLPRFTRRASTKQRKGKKQAKKKKSGKKAAKKAKSNNKDKKKDKKDDKKKDKKKGKKQQTLAPLAPPAPAVRAKLDDKEKPPVDPLFKDIIPEPKEPGKKKKADGAAKKVAASKKQKPKAAKKGKAGKKKQGKKAKGKKKQGKKGQKKQRPSVLVRDWVDVDKQVTAQRLHAKVVDSENATIHVMTAHKSQAANKEYTIFDEGYQRIRIAAFLDIKGSVAFVKRVNAAKKKKATAKKVGAKKKGKKAGAAKKSAAVPPIKQKQGLVAKLAAGPAFLEDLHIISKYAPVPADNSHIDQPMQHILANEITHQWELVSEHANDFENWMYISADNQQGSMPVSRSHAEPEHQHLFCHLSSSSSSSSLSPSHVFIPSMSFSGQLRTLKRVYTHLPPHSLLQISGTFHFIGHWHDEVASLSIDGQPVWLDTFNSHDDSSHSSSLASATDASSPLHSQHVFSVPFSVSVPHSTDLSTIEFGSSLSANHEGATHGGCWSVDNVRVAVSEN